MIPVSSLLSRLRDGVLRHKRRRYPELLNRHETEQIQLLAQRTISSSLDINLEVHQQLLGENLSQFAKHGFEFAEIKPYQAGDNVRFINWRRYAQTGKLFVNRFHEERRPQCWIIFDRGSSMRFATRGRLKVGAGAILALYHLLKSQHQQFAVGAVVLDQQPHWYPAQTTARGLQPLRQHMLSPCPPLAQANRSLLVPALRSLRARLQPGCLIFIISDFYHMNDESDSLLCSLANEHIVSALHIADPAELMLPQRGEYSILDPETNDIVNVDCEQPTIKQQLDQQLSADLYDKENRLKALVMHYRRYMTSDNLFSDMVSQ